MCSNRLQLDTRHFNLEKYLVIILCGQPGHQSHLLAVCRVQGVVCGHKLGFLLLQVASNKYYSYYSTSGGFEGRSVGSGESRRQETAEWEEVDTNTM